MRYKKKRRSERKKDLREKYRREDLKKKRVINADLGDRERKSRRVSAPGSPDTVLTNNRINLTKSRRIGTEYYGRNIVESEKLKEIRKKKQKLTSLRRKEREAYNNLNLAGRIDNKSGVYVELLKEYNQLRQQRMKLQAELEELRNNKYSYLL